MVRDPQVNDLRALTPDADGTPRHQFRRRRTSAEGPPGGPLKVAYLVSVQETSDAFQPFGRRSRAKKQRDAAKGTATGSETLR